MTFEQARIRFLAEGIPAQTVDAFFDNFNREIWEAFETFALQSVSARKKVGAKAIMERIRWEVEIEHRGSFKVSNNWTAYYARLFALKYPQAADYFTFKEVKGVTV